MDQSMDLHLELTADASSSVSGIQQTREQLEAFAATSGVSKDSLDRLNASLEELIAQFKGAATASSTAAAGMAETGVAATGLTVTVTAVTENAKALEGTMRSMGIAGAEGAAQLGAMGDAMRGLLGASGPLLIAVTALTAAFGAFEFLKTGTEEAINAQRSFEALRVQVEALGGSWEQTKQSIEQWSQAMVIAGVSSDSVTASLNRLVQAGASYADAEKELTVGAQMVIAGMGTWAEVTEALTQAQGGNMRGLARLDPAIRDLVRTHADLATILQVVQDQTGNQITQNDSAALATARMQAAQANLAEEIGKDMLPQIGQLSNAWSIFIDTLDHVLHAYSEFIQGVNQAGKGLIEGAVHSGKSFVEGLIGNPDAFAEQTKAADAFSGALRGVGTAVQGIGKEFDYALHPVNTYLHDTAEQLKILKDAVKGVGSLDNDPIANQQLGTGAGAGQSDFKPMALAGQFDDVTQAGQVAMNVLRQFSETQADLTAKMNAAGTQTEYLADKQQLYAESITGLQTVIARLDSAHTLEAQALAKVNSETATATKVYNDAATAYDNALAAAGPADQRTEAQTKTLAALRDTAQEAKQHLDTLTQQQSKLQSQVGQTTDQIAKQQKALADLKNEVPDLSRGFDDWLNKQQASTRESYNEIGKSTQQLFEYFSSLYESDYQLYLKYQQEKNATLLGVIIPAMEQAGQKANQYQLQLYQEDYQNRKHVYDQETQTTSSFLDNLIVQHKSLAQSLKAIYDEILRDFIDMVSKMIVESSLFQSIFGFLIPGTSPAGGNVFGSGWGYVPGGFASLAGAAGGASGAGSIAPSASAGGFALLPSGLGLGGGGGAAMSAPGGGVSLASTAPRSAFGGAVWPPVPGGWSLSSPNSGDDGFPSGRSGGWSVTSLAGTPGGSVSAFPLLGGAALRGGSLAGLGISGGLGALGGQLLFGGKGFSDLGGAIGGAAAFGGIFAALGGFGAGGLLPFLGALGPVGWGIIAAGILGGSFLGSLFGNHFDPKDEPDIYQQDAWGQSNADMQGLTSSKPMMANGKAYVMDSWTSQATNGKGWNILFENFVQQFRANPSVLPQDLQDAFPEIENLWGGAVNKNYFNDDGKDGYLDIGSGERALWSKFWSYVQQYGPEISTLMASAAPTQVYNAAINGAVTPAGSFAPSASSAALSHGLPDPGSGGAASNFGLASSSAIANAINSAILATATYSPSGSSTSSNSAAALLHALNDPGSTGLTGSGSGSGGGSSPGNGGGGHSPGSGGGGNPRGGGGKQSQGVTVNVYQQFGGSLLAQRGLEEMVRSAFAATGNQFSLQDMQGGG